MSFLMKTKHKTILVIPFLGMFGFLLLYVVAALNYPGGSYLRPYEKGFSFWNNYLCDLLDTYTIAGVLNTSSAYARLALLVLCTTLIFFWYHLPKLFAQPSINQKIMKYAGMLALAITLLLSSGNHDVIVRIAGVFGVVAMGSSFVELYRSRYFKLFGCGVFCLIILLVNYYVYETGSYIQVLPVIQKGTFASFIIWFLLMDFCLYKRLKNQAGT